MSTIRRQSILSSLVVYIGFALGFLNMYLFTREGGFTKEQYGLTGIFIAIASLMYSFASLGSYSYIYKFYPYYNDNLKKEENDMPTLALIVSGLGFILVTLTSLLFKDIIVRKFSANSEDLVTYFYWILPFGLGLTIFSVLEAYAWQLKKSVLTNFLREIQFRLFTTILILLTFSGIIGNFDTFIKIYSFTYLGIAVILLSYLLISKQIQLQFSLSRVTKKFYKRILTLAGFVWSGSLIYNVANVFDSLVIAAVIPNGLAYVAVFTVAQNIASLIQAPQRGIIAASISSLSQAWKDKDLGRISRIYERSSINQLIFSVGIFVLIWINFVDGVTTLNMQQGYLDARFVFLFIGLLRIIDMGTGVNAQIIGTSIFWRFEFLTGIILLGLALPLNYYLTKEMGVIGPAISNLIAFSIYNVIRCHFLWRKYRMQPFTRKSFLTLLIGLAGFLICHWLFNEKTGFLYIFLRSATFSAIFVSGVYFFKLSPDVQHIFSRLRLNRK